ncbi:MAG: CoA transferase [Acidimicrobiia bacterium]|nr:CoA transferase [Acidimicrobiia bacterium]
MPTVSGALEGVRVLDLSTLVQGPQAGAMLYNLGADVIKVELPDIGDVGRHVSPLQAFGHSAVFVANNRGKRSITLDLRTPGGKSVLERLAAQADVVLSNFKPGTLDEWGLGYDDLSALNPRLIWAAGSYLGSDGPDAEREGADMVGQAYGGLISTTGDDDGPMTPIGALIADHSGAQNLAIGVLSALFARERTGEGQRVDVSLVGSQIWAQATEYTHYLLTGEMAGRSNGGHPLVNALYGIFATADGYIALAGCPEHLWPGMVRAVERPELADNPRFGTYFATPEIRAELREAFSEIFVTRTTAEWSERLAAEEQRFAPVRNHAEVAADPQVLANGYLASAEHPEWGTICVVGSPIVLSDTPARWGVEVPELGQHTEEVLVEHGFSWDEIGELRESGSV